MLNELKEIDLASRVRLLEKRMEKNERFVGMPLWKRVMGGFVILTLWLLIAGPIFAMTMSQLEHRFPELFPVSTIQRDDS